MSTAILVFALAFSTSVAATRAVIPLLSRKGMLDFPNERSSHFVPTPRGGGLGILAGIIAAWVLIACLSGVDGRGITSIAMVLLLAATGFADDQRNLPPILRLLVQIVAAASVSVATGGLETLPVPEPYDAPTGILAIPLAVVWIVGVANIFNFMDGIDGLAGVQGAIAGFSVVLLAPSEWAALTGLAVAGSCLAFLVYNWSPAKIFMGDVGSVPLGFLFAVLPLMAPTEIRSSVVIGTALALWFFLSDGAITILRRLLNGEAIWKPHRAHLYQRLARTGLSHSQVVLRLTIPMTAVAGFGVLGTHTSAALVWACLGLASGSSLVYTYLVRRREA